MICKGFGPMLKQHAAQSDVQRYVAVPLYDADVNLNGSLRLIELPREYAVQKFIYSSSGEDVKISFFLLIDGGSTPYRTLHLFTRVVRE